MNKLPKARTENIVVQNLEKETLLYDTITDQAFCLNETSAKIYNACDGATSFDELKRKYQFTDDLIYLALDELQAKNLLDSAADYKALFAGMSRREVIRKVGFATMIALPVVAGIIAPQAANAASGATLLRGQTCTATSQCVSGNRCATTNGGTRRCCASTNTNQPQEPGTNLGTTSNATCTNVVGPNFCCSGSATNNPNGTQGCVCN